MLTLVHFAVVELSTRPSKPKLKTCPSERVMPFERKAMVVPSTTSSPVVRGTAVAVTVVPERGRIAIVSSPLKRLKEEVETLRNTAARKLMTDDDVDSTMDDDTTTNTNSHATEMASLRSVIRTQLSDIKSLKSELSALRKEMKTLKSTRSDSSAVASLESTISALRTENTSLQNLLATKEADYEAVNKAMDEKLAVLLSKLMKEKAKTVVGKRDGQWSESVKELESEREVLGKVAMRQWGREEVGVDEERETKDGKQGYRYKYVKR